VKFWRKVEPTQKNDTYSGDLFFLPTTGGGFFILKQIILLLIKNLSLMDLHYLFFYLVPQYVTERQKSNTYIRIPQNS
jgi:hypothetical protein